MESKKLIIISSAIIIISLIGFSIVMAFMIKENQECISNPLTYGAESLKKAGGEYFCSCSSLRADLLDFSFDKEGIYIKDPTIPFSKQEINLSNIIIERDGLVG